jgi:hypothetical protein
VFIGKGDGFLDGDCPLRPQVVFVADQGHLYSDSCVLLDFLYPKLFYIAEGSPAGNVVYQ